MNKKLRHICVKNAVIMCFGIILASHTNDIHADTFQSVRYTSKLPVTSQNCNEFTFDAKKSHLPPHTPVSYLWDLGDGTTSIEPVVTHTYARSGDYDVRLSVTDNSGFECSTASTMKSVRVQIPPQASLISDDQACINEGISLDASASYSDSTKDLRYLWNFGDGSVINGKKQMTKSYAKGGDYKISLTVDNGGTTVCHTATIDKRIHINEPPKAQAGDAVILKCVSDSEDMTVHFDASATTDVNNDPLTYLWDFGDGYTEKGREVAHRFGEIGNYDVKLIASDNTNLGCGTDVDFITVRLNRAPEADAGEDILTCTGKDINFDGSNSYIHKEGTADARWFFGDGASRSGLQVIHRYYKPGTYQATLSIENKLNRMCPVARDTRVVTVNSSPTVSIKYLKTSCTDKEIFFDASSAMDPDGDELEYIWNFGDGTTSRGRAKVSHTYTQGGDYRVSVIVDDRRGTSCSTDTAQMNIHINTPPIADAGPNLSCCTDKIATFTASASSDPDGDRLTYHWDLGDGSKRQGETITHTYSQSGLYNVILTVDDQSPSACHQSIDSFTAEVKETPIPLIIIR